VDSGAIRSVVVLDRLLGVGTVIVVHHTGNNSCYASWCANLMRVV